MHTHTLTYAPTDNLQQAIDIVHTRFETDTIMVAQFSVSSPGVAWYGASLRVLVGERVNMGAQPLAFALVHGVQNMEHLVTSYVQWAIVQLAGDVQIETDVERVSGYHCAIFNVLQQPPVAWKQENRVKTGTQ